MALNETLLGTEIKDEIDAVFDVKSATILKKFADAVAKAVVNHIKDNAEVSTTTTGTVTSGPGAGGATAGTGTGTVS